LLIKIVAIQSSKKSQPGIYHEWQWQGNHSFAAFGAMGAMDTLATVANGKYWGNN